MAAVNFSIEQAINLSAIDKLDASIILSHILKLTTVELIMQHDRSLSQSEKTLFDDLCLKRQNGMPISYITGYKEFYSHQFKVTPDTLIPRPETEFIIDAALALAKPGYKILDLGTGCGAIAISLKLSMTELIVDGIDKSSEALNIAKQNASSLSSDVNFYLSDWFSHVHDKYDIIVGNPPYIALNDVHLAALSYEPQDALTDYAHGTSCLEHIIKYAPKYLKDNGYLILEHGYDQGDRVRQLYKASGFGKISTIKDYAKLDRITLGKI